MVTLHIHDLHHQIFLLSIVYPVVCSYLPFPACICGLCSVTALFRHFLRAFVASEVSLLSFAISCVHIWPLKCHCSLSPFPASICGL